MKKLPSWKEVEIAGILTSPGNSIEYKTGEWRTHRPIIDLSKCDKCGACWIFCPDAAISLTIKGYEINLDYCKGCGICARECWRQAITMVQEEE